MKTTEAKLAAMKAHDRHLKPKLVHLRGISTLIKSFNQVTTSHLDAYLTG